MTKVTELNDRLNEAPNNHALYLDMAGGREIAHEVKGVALPPSYRLVRVDNRKKEVTPQEHFELALINDATSEVVYYNHAIIQPDAFLINRPVIQLSPWRTQKPKHREILHDFARVIFVGYLLVRHEVIVSVENLACEGVSFWMARMYDALEHGFHLYAYDLITRELLELKNETELGRGWAWLWGDTEHVTGRVAILSQCKLLLASWWPCIDLPKLAKQNP